MSARTIEAIYPLSPVQEGLLYHTLAAPDAQVYHNQLDCTLYGVIEPAIFQRAWQMILDRHSILRSAITWRRQGQPVQVVQQHLTLPWSYQDWRGISPLEQERHLVTFARADAGRSFDVAQAPLLRLALLRTDEECFHLLWSYHHILLDGWSVSLVLKEVITCYEALCHGENPALPSLRPYQDYIAWLHQQDLTQAEAFWQHTLHGFVPTPLVMDHRPAKQDGTLYVENLEPGENRKLLAAEEWLQISPETTSALQAFAREQHLTLSTLVQGAYALLLSHYSGEQDIVFGVTTSGRSGTLPGIESMVGLFINTLPLRLSVPPALPLLTWLHQVQERHLEMTQYEYSPLVKVQEWSQSRQHHSGVEWRLRGTSLFESLLVFENYPVDPSLQRQGQRLYIESVHAVEQTNYALTLVARAGKQLALGLSYQSARFEAAAMQRMLGHLQSLLEGLLASPQQHLANVPLLTEAERQQLMVEWNTTAAEYPSEHLLHELVEGQARRTPDAVALVCQHEHVTYSELHTRANQLAHYLRQQETVFEGQGIGPETRIGICLERSLEVAVALLAILKVGGAYVPLDPTYPPARLASILCDAQANDEQPLLVLTQQSLLSVLPQEYGRVVCLDSERTLIDACSRDTLKHRAAAQNPAYIIYTSGSTGKPKGTVITHEAVVHHATAIAGYYALRPGDRVLQIASMSFDVAVEEMFPAWSSGATVVVYPDAALLAPVDVLRLVAQEQLSVLNLSAAFWHDLVDELMSMDSAPVAMQLASLRLLVVGSDAVLAEKLVRWKSSIGEAVRWVNAYGPTEATITSILYEPRQWQQPQAVDAAIVPIGRPIANMQVYVLNIQGEPVPVGVVGELYLGGAGLARGYLNHPALTAERFVPHPFSMQPGARLYRTGDRVRYRADGVLEFLGRIDWQVKLRGFRIELGEIEARLRNHPLVREAVVLLREDQPGNKRLVAYIVPAETHQHHTRDEQRQFIAPATPTATELRQYLKEAVPDYMLPAVYVPLEQLPRTLSGKVERRKLPVPQQAAVAVATEANYAAPQSDVERRIAALWQEVLQVEKVGLHENFFDLGGHSLLLARVYRQLRTAFAYELSMIDLFRHPTVSTLATFLSQKPGESSSLTSGQRQAATHQAPIDQQSLDIHSTVTSNTQGETPFHAHERESIAIIGMAGRFPGAKNIAEFWSNLQNGMESLTTFTEQELLETGIPAAMLHDPNYVRLRGMMENIDLFDAAFFGYTPREAEILDPQQRIFLECAWEALEDAGYDPETCGERTGVFAGTSSNNYLLANLYPNRPLLETVGMFQIANSSEKDFVTTRVSYKLNLRGPSVNVQSACSTSLVAVHMACQSLLNGECDLVLAGGVCVNVPQKAGYLYQSGGIFSPDGHCRAFDASAQGTVTGDGVGIVVLKRLTQALADGDTIAAVIKGSAINNDGSLKIGYTAPSIDGQARVIAKAQALAGVQPETISYIEAHGTGTPLGDPIEMAALTQVFRASTPRQGFCAIGSVKTNIGHLDVAAGVAGLIKTVLALKHAQIPASLHFQKPNPQIEFATSPFSVPTSLTAWPSGATPRRAGVSSFGIGGTNAHVVLEEAPTAAFVRADKSSRLLILSARTVVALDAMSTQLAVHLREHPHLDLADVAYTLHAGRRAFPHRRTLVCSSVEDAAHALSDRATPRVLTAFQEKEHRPVVFLFPGQGTQHIHMAEELYRNEPIFRQQIDHCAELLIPHLGLDIRDLLYPTPERADEATRRLTQTALTQPALFTIEYALARLWIAWGVQPHAMLGHSIGEYVAACLAGVFSLPDALALVATRGRMMQQLPPGAMLSVFLAEADLLPLLGKQLSVAAINAPARCVVSGPTEAVEELEHELVRCAITCRRLHTSHAFHSIMMSPIALAFATEVSKVERHPPRIPYISNVTGTWITAEAAMDANYWASHLCQMVRFSAGIQELENIPERLFLEVGPGRTLSGIVLEHLASYDAEDSKRLIVSSLPNGYEKQPDYAFLLTTLGRLWLAGVPLDWQHMYDTGQQRRIPLPTYPFERQHYWVSPPSTITPSSSGQSSTAQTENTVTLRKRPDIGQWLYLPSWRRSLLSTAAPHLSEVSPVRVLLFADARGIATQVAQRLRQQGHEVISVWEGEQFASVQERVYTLNARQPEQYDALLQNLWARSWLPTKIIHCWTLTHDPGNTSLLADQSDTWLDVGFYSVLYLTQALGRLLASVGEDSPVQLEIISHNVQSVTGEETLYPAQATVLGLCMVIPQEYPSLTCRSMDIVLPPAGTRQEEKLLDRLVLELSTPPTDDMIAYRGQHRWIRAFEPVRLEQTVGANGQALQLRVGGVYLLTGGLGEIGLVMASYLTRHWKAKLVLTTRSAFPARAAWPQWLATYDSQDLVCQRIRKVLALEEQGAEVLLCQADVADREQMQDVLTQISQRFGTLHGVVHLAGIVSDATLSPIQELGRADCEVHFQSKIRGLLVLEEVVRGVKLDFCLLQSSLATILGGVGYAAYAAANLFMDSFAQQQNQISAFPWLCVNWDSWHSADNDAEPVIDGPLAQPPALTDFSMTQQEGEQALVHILAVGNVPQLVVSTGDLPARLAQQARKKDRRIAQEHVRHTTQFAVNAASTSGIVAPRNDIEQAIAESWQDVLGIKEVGVDDNFFDLGGYSVMAIQVIARLRKTLSVELGIQALFEHPTVAQLAVVVAQASVQKQQAQRPVLKPLARSRNVNSVEVRKKSEA